MAEQTFLGRLRVVRGDRHDAVHAGIGGSLCQVQPTRGVVGACPGDHRHLVADRVNSGLEQGDLLDLGKGRRLAGGASHHDAVRAVTGEEAG